MFDLRAISSIAPIGDLAFGLFLMLVAVTIGNLLIIPKLLSHRAWSAYALLAVTLLGLIAAVATLAIDPPHLYVALFVYVVAFCLIGLIASWRVIGWWRALARVVFGAACMLTALGVAHWIAYAPR